MGWLRANWKPLTVSLVLVAGSFFVFPISGALTTTSAEGPLAGTNVSELVNATAIGDAPGLNPDAFGGAPIFQGALIVDGGRALVFVGYNTWGGTYQVVSNNTQVFASALVVYALDLTQINVLLDMTTALAGQTSSSSLVLYPGAVETTTINLPDHTSWTSLLFTIGGTDQYYQYATPISLLPPSIANVGGLDLLVLAVVYEMMLVAAVSIWAADRFMRRALYAPKVSLFAFGHVPLFALLAAVVIDYQWVDQTFAGWSPVLYAFVFVPIIFLGMLYFFNRTEVAQIVRANTPKGGRFSFHTWYVDVGTTPNGDRTLIDPSWPGMWARALLHYVPFTAVEDSITKPEKFEAELKEQPLFSRKKMIDMEVKPRTRKILGRVRHATPAKSDPMDDFVAIPASIAQRPLTDRRRPTKFYMTPTGMPVDAQWPHLSIHKTVEVPAKVDRSGTTVVPAHTEQRLALPHYTDGRATITLAPWHFVYAWAAISGWLRVEDLATLLGETQFGFEMLKAHFDSEVARKVREHMLGREAVRDLSTRELSSEEAALEALRIRGVPPTLWDLYGNDAVARPLTKNDTDRPKEGQ